MFRNVKPAKSSTIYTSYLQQLCIPCSQHGPLPGGRWIFLVLFPIAKGPLKFLLVGIDYFTKWVEAEALAKITATNVQRFTWKRIICRYGLPHAITTDNGKHGR
uniref:Integrase catalytic domain-containing protein n=1 Tax=Cajanus cajan TaxID=3821 RepID=A0A151S7T1_CAJCA|nr:hypothetical protein KK1_027402 [Cajanus cajan]KYP50837.1 hypothetical protein KK1_027403 [Cajanus cajan]KYP50839.1 hypothetical protein KK1_027405 [Cajanus cajan]